VKYLASCILCLDFDEISRLCLESFWKYSQKPEVLFLLLNNWRGNKISLPQNTNTEIQKFEKNIPIPKCFNFAIQRAIEFQLPYILLFNNDVFFTPGWFEELKEGLKQGEFWGLAPALSKIAGGQQVLPVFLPDFKSLLDIEKAWEEIKPRLLRLPRFQKLDFITNCVSLYPLIVFEKIGLFDEQFEWNGEDNDFSIRVKLQGGSFLLCTHSFVFHKTGHARQRLRERKYFLHTFSLLEKKWKKNAKILTYSRQQL
jgi:GT2 family glycosyltransferase